LLSVLPNRDPPFGAPPYRSFHFARSSSTCRPSPWTQDESFEDRFAVDQRTGAEILADEFEDIERE
jgi:hypothetical protein